MTIDEQVEKRVYKRLRAYDGVEVAGHAPVNSSIASVLSEGEVLADNGEQYSSIQQAVDVSDGFVFVGPGTYYENVVIDRDDFTLQGAGKNTLIDGGDIDNAITISSSNVHISSISVQTGLGVTGFNTNSGIESLGTSSNCVISDVTCEQTGDRGFVMVGSEHIIDGCTIDSPTFHGMSVYAPRSIVKNCKVNNASSRGIDMDGNDQILVNNVITNSGEYGISSRDPDQLIGGNRVSNSGNDGIYVSGNGVDCIIFNNRVSGSTNQDIDNNGSGTVTEGNLTGSAN